MKDSLQKSSISHIKVLRCSIHLRNACSAPWWATALHLLQYHPHLRYMIEAIETSTISMFRVRSFIQSRSIICIRIFISKLVEQELIRINIYIQPQRQ